MVQQIESKEAFQEALNDAGDKLVVVDFSATWCGPCKMIKPFFHSLSEKYSKVVFLEVDVDDCQDVAAECEVKCMPTFQFFKKGKKVSEFSGANKEKLEATINEDFA
uniref:Thioredoxin n=1 Tax=Cavia porcellus TaxID=10141 RepID=H0W1R6_CAVPO